MKRESLERIAPLLEILRSNPVLHEIRPTEFQLDGSDFLHFHERAEGIVADVLLKRGRLSMSVSTAADQAELLGQIERILSSLGSRERDRWRRPRYRRQSRTSRRAPTGDSADDHG